MDGFNMKNIKIDSVKANSVKPNSIKAPSAIKYTSNLASDVTLNYKVPDYMASDEDYNINYDFSENIKKYTISQEQRLKMYINNINYFMVPFSLGTSITSNGIKYHIKNGLCTKIEYSNGIVMNIEYGENREIINYKYTAIVDGKETSINIFGSYTTEYGQYGGDQGAFKYNAQKLLQDPIILEKLKNTYPEATMEDYELYLEKLNSVGCGYTAFVNAVFKEFEGKEDLFLKTFGFPMYTVDENGNLDFNYEYLIIELFNYVWGNSGYTMEELLNGKITGTAGGLGYNYYNNPYNATYTTYVQWLASKYGYVFQRNEYSQKDFSSKVLANDDPELLEYLKKYKPALYKLYLENGGLPDTELYIFNKDKLVKYINENKDKVLVIGTTNFPLYDLSGSKCLESSVGPHLMTITGVNEYGVIVSSWGKSYLIPFEYFNKLSFTLHELNLF